MLSLEKYIFKIIPNKNQINSTLIYKSQEIWKLHMTREEYVKNSMQNYRTYLLVVWSVSLSWLTFSLCLSISCSLALLHSSLTAKRLINASHCKTRKFTLAAKSIEFYDTIEDKNRAACRKQCHIPHSGRGQPGSLLRWVACTSVSSG